MARRKQLPGSAGNPTPEWAPLRSPLRVCMRPRFADPLDDVTMLVAVRRVEELVMTARHPKSLGPLLEELRVEADLGTRLYTPIMMFMTVWTCRKRHLSLDELRPDFERMIDAGNPQTPMGWAVVRYSNLLARLIVRGARRRMAEAVYQGILSTPEPHYEWTVPTTSRGRRRLNKPAA